MVTCSESSKEGHLNDETNNTSKKSGSRET